MIEVTLRAIFSLAVVLFLMWGLARLVRRPLGARGAGALAVLSRQPLSRTASVAVVKVDDRALVLGVTDGQVTYLTEAPLAAFERVPFADVLADAQGDDVLDSSGRSSGAVSGAAPGARSAPEARSASRARHAAHEADRGPLAGSMLSPATWYQAVEFLRDRSSRPR
ncbi:flagellar biosynthetic protein FliO [Cryptosporangium aurantiacum]|uniref:Flagellar protein n=1 Tax=Cryptosporangium aurantiacum TaxID=134849 RepID=A0A1M7R7E0_9ACTN|nr:flagellar biosynthetic protein FliO [Cryptosporangium aurantiacum]SHN42062.1 flagellar protein FliO/FliZ [Cryptosporangium aurantiacum]